MNTNYKNSVAIITSIIDGLNNSIKECADEIDRARLETCRKGLELFFMTDKEIAQCFFMFNKVVPEEEMDDYVASKKDEIEQLRNDRVRGALYWIANHFDLVG